MKSLGSFHLPPEIRGNYATTPEITARQGGTAGGGGGPADRRTRGPVAWRVDKQILYCRHSRRREGSFLPTQNMMWFSNKKRKRAVPSLAVVLFPEAHKCSHDTRRYSGNLSLSHSSAKASSSTLWQGQPVSSVHTPVTSLTHHNTHTRATKN